MKKQLLLCAAIALTAITATAQPSISAQQITLPDFDRFAFDVANARTGAMNGFALADFDGSPYLYSDWQAGKIIYNSGKEQDIKVNYFIPGDKFVVEQSKDSVIIADFTPSMLAIIIDGHPFMQVSYDGSTVVMEQLYAQNSTVLKQYSVTVKKRQDASGYNQERRARFIQSSKLYYTIGSGEITLLPNSTSKFFAIFGVKATIMKKYANDNHLKISREADIVKIFEHFDSL